MAQPPTNLKIKSNPDFVEKNIDNVTCYTGIYTDLMCL